MSLSGEETEPALTRLSGNIKRLVGVVAGLELVLRTAERIDDSHIQRVVPHVALFWLYASAMCDVLQAKRPDGRTLWNAPALAVLCRALQDAFISLYYFGVEETPPEEAEFRELLFLRHVAFKRFDLLRRSDPSVPEVARELADAKQQYDALQERFTAHPFLVKLEAGVAKELTGKPDRFIAESLHEAWKRAGMPVDMYDQTFRFLSQFTHATPHALAHLTSHKAEHEDGAVNMNLPVGLAVVCGITALRFMGKIHSDVDALLPAAFHEFMAEPQTGYDGN